MGTHREPNEFEKIFLKGLLDFVKIIQEPEFKNDNKILELKYAFTSRQRGQA